MSTLNTTVALVDDEGNSHYFGPGDSVPKWARKRITNPDVWADSPSDDNDADDAPTETVWVETPEQLVMEIPPKAGPGSSAKAWAAYALTKGFESAEDAKASEIREALAEAGIPVE